VLVRAHVVVSLGLVSGDIGAGAGAGAEAEAGVEVGIDAR
jgi:hypothetical protein